MEYETLTDVGQTIKVYEFWGLEGFSHCHKSVEFNFSLEGLLSGYVGNNYYDARKGEIIFVPSLFSHNIYSNSPDSHSLTIIVPVSYFQTFQIDPSTFFYDLLLTDTKANMELYEIGKNIRGDGSIRDKGYFAIFLDKFMKTYEKRDFRSNKEDSLIIDIILYIEAHYRENISLESISNDFHFSRYYFSKLFNRFFLCSFTDYVNSLRLQYVLDHMNSGAKLSELIFEAGFQSISSFYRTKDIHDKKEINSEQNEK